MTCLSSHTPHRLGAASPRPLLHLTFSTTCPHDAAFWRICGVNLFAHCRNLCVSTCEKPLPSARTTGCNKIQRSISPISLRTVMTHITKECYYLLRYLSCSRHINIPMQVFVSICKFTTGSPGHAYNSGHRIERHQASSPASSCLTTMTSSLELSSIFSAVQGMAASISTLGSSMPKA